MVAVCVAQSDVAWVVGHSDDVSLVNVEHRSELQPRVSVVGGVRGQHEDVTLQQSCSCIDLTCGGPVLLLRHLLHMFLGK